MWENSEAAQVDRVVARVLNGGGEIYNFDYLGISKSLGQKENTYEYIFITLLSKIIERKKLILSYLMLPPPFIFV